MNFCKFRQTGDLSDITVVVDGTEFKLHKFPLYAKSDFFCALAKSPGADCNRVELKEFPGGPEAFGVVADFCYNMTVDVTKTNVVHIRCAAEVLQMTGSGNLAEVSEKFLMDTIASAKISRATSVVSGLLMSCVSAAAVAEKANIVNVTSEALVDCWLKPPTKFSMPAASKKAGNERTDENVRQLVGLPVSWLLKLLALAKEKGVKNSLLAELATRYITHYLEKDDTEDRASSAVEQKKSDTSDSKLAAKSGRPSNADVDLLKDAKLTSKSKRKSDTGKVLDAIITELPEAAFTEDSVTTDWVTKVLKIATLQGCKCRRILVRVAGDRLKSLSSDDLCIISPSVLKDIVSESCNGDSNQASNACQLVENYMNEMARKGVLTAETYKALVNASPPEGRTSHDSLYGILEYVLTAEKDKLTADQRTELMDTVDVTLLGEATLKRAFETQVVPASYVAKGALSLCSKLKSDLESAKNTVCKQEEELQRLRRTRNSTPQMTSSPKKDMESAHSSFAEIPERDTGIAHGNHHSAAELPSEILPVHSPGLSSVTEEVLLAARNKLATSVAAYNTFRPLSVDRDTDYSFEDEMDFKYDRHIRSYDNARKTRSAAGYHRSSYLYPHRL